MAYLNTSTIFCKSTLDYCLLKWFKQFRAHFKDSYNLSNNPNTTIPSSG